MSQVNSLLLVDDNDDDCFLIKHYVKAAGFTGRFDVSENGLEAINLIKEMNFNQMDSMLILLDLNMPIMNGLEFLEEFFKFDKEITSADIRIVVLTSSESEEDQSRIEQFSKDIQYLVKPVSKSTIGELLLH